MKVCSMRVGFRGRSFWPCRCASAGVVHKQEASSTDARLAKCKVGDGGAKKLDKSVHCGGRRRQGGEREGDERGSVGVPTGDFWAGVSLVNCQGHSGLARTGPFKRAPAWRGQTPDRPALSLVAPGTVTWSPGQWTGDLGLTMLASQWRELAGRLVTWQNWLDPRKKRRKGQGQG